MLIQVYTRRKHNFWTELEIYYSFLPFVPFKSVGSRLASPIFQEGKIKQSFQFLPFLLDFYLLLKNFPLFFLVFALFIIFPLSMGTFFPCTPLPLARFLRMNLTDIVTILLIRLAQQNNTMSVNRLFSSLAIISRSGPYWTGDVIN